MKEIVLENSYVSLNELTSELNHVYRTAQHIVVAILGMRRVAARLIPKNLIFVQRHDRKTISGDLISEAKNDPTFMKLLITGSDN